MVARHRRIVGFSLLELTLVLIILTLLFGSLTPGLTALREAARQKAAERQLEQAAEALLGFAIRHGRLPCPAIAASRGAESPSDGGRCDTYWDGLLPATTLGLQPIDTAGQLADPWGNPLRYAVSDISNPACGESPCLTSENGIRDAWSSTAPPSPDLLICSTATGASGSSACASGKTLVKDAVAIVFSLGPNGLKPAVSRDEMANRDNNRLFISRDPALPPDEFDDRMYWIASPIFYSRLMAAGRLP